MSGCVVSTCLYEPEADSSYCALHGVKWRRSQAREKTLLDWQELLDEATRGCLAGGMTPGDVADWVSETLREVEDSPAH